MNVRGDIASTTRGFSSIFGAAGFFFFFQPTAIRFHPKVLRAYCPSGNAIRLEWSMRSSPCKCSTQCHPIPHACDDARGNACRVRESSGEKCNWFGRIRKKVIRVCDKGVRFAGTDDSAQRQGLRDTTWPQEERTVSGFRMVIDSDLGRTFGISLETFRNVK